MPRARLPLDDGLLTAGEAAARICISKNRWWTYYRRHECLVRGRRVVRVDEDGRGVYRWLRSAVIAHIHNELPSTREVTA